MIKKIKDLISKLFPTPISVDAPIMHELINGVKRRTIILALMEGKRK